MPAQYVKAYVKRNKNDAAPRVARRAIEWRITTTS
jgi:transposase